MPVFTTEGIIVKRKNFGEADRILTIMTPFRGKMAIVAKGVRRITSRRGGNVELLNKVKLHIFRNRGMGILTEADSIQTFPKIKQNLMLSSYASHIIELIDRLVPDEQINPGTYQLLATILEVLENNPRQIFIRAFEVKLLSELGFWSINQIETNDQTKNLLNDLQKNGWDKISEMVIDSTLTLELEAILRYYIEKVLESPLRSAKIIKELRVKN
jgi:DNA repair protein RecO (recombination protein O)